MILLVLSLALSACDQQSVDESDALADAQLDNTEDGNEVLQSEIVASPDQQPTLIAEQPASMLQDEETPEASSQSTVEPAQIEAVAGTVSG